MSCAMTQKQITESMADVQKRATEMSAYTTDATMNHVL